MTEKIVEWEIEPKKRRLERSYDIVKKKVQKSIRDSRLHTTKALGPDVDKCTLAQQKKV